ncbi:hypothetical protein N752_18250 [Desulforamulus aquiferis]|nr:hypothetical protein N752_18250 [Desulforamulus aquiferis]
MVVLKPRIFSKLPGKRDDKKIMGNKARVTQPGELIFNIFSTV